MWTNYDKHGQCPLLPLSDINCTNMPVFIRLIIIQIALLTIILHTSAQVAVELVEFADGFTRPVSMTHAGDSRLFIVEKRGTIRIVEENGNVRPGFFLDIRDRVDDSASEKGLLGLAFHPDYVQNGFFYVNYTNANGTVVARFSVDAQNPDLAIASSEFVLLTQSQPFNNHNAGDIHFGPDGYLYIGFGDGGSAGDPGNRAQNPMTWLGKMLRIDVNGGEPYLVPEDNPFVGDPAYLPEIWATGLRNPWRFSFDRVTGEMYIADVGQNIWEEINVQPAESPGGGNYGWRCYEGFEDFNFSNCSELTAFTEPVWVYPHSIENGCSITGGYVYRSETPGSPVNGRYIYTDFCSGQFWMLYRDFDGNWINESLGKFLEGEFSAFGEDVHGELFVAALFQGKIFRVTFSILDAVQSNSVSKLEIFPNPAQGPVVTQLNSSALAGVSVFNQMGEAMHATVTEQDGERMTMDVTSFPDGVYFVRVTQNETVYLGRVIKLGSF